MDDLDENTVQLLMSGLIKYKTEACMHYDPPSDHHMLPPLAVIGDTTFNTIDHSLLMFDGEDWQPVPAIASNDEGGCCSDHTITNVPLTLDSTISTNFHMDISTIQPSVITISNPDSHEMLVNISHEGELTFGDNYEPDTAARIFWEAIMQINPIILQKRIEVLEDRLVVLAEDQMMDMDDTTTANNTLSSYDNAMRIL